MPSALNWLDYEVPTDLLNEIKIGQLVNIPLRGQTIFGVVYKLSETTTSKIKLKPITSIVNPKPFLSEPQLAWLKELADFYKTPLGFLVKMNLPPLQKNKLKKITSDVSAPQAAPPDKKFSKPQLVIRQITEIGDWLISNIAHTGQVLILVPELANIDAVIQKMPGEWKNQTVVFSSDLTEKLAFTAWMDIWSEKKRIVVGTRTALFLPWTDLRQIIILNEANFDYKSWDMAPRFHTRDAALFLARQHDCSLTLVDHTPSVDSWFFATKKVYGLDGELSPVTNPISVVNLRDEKRFGNYGSISFDLKKKITECSGDVFLLAGRVGSFAYTFCHDCGEVVACPNCKKPQVYIRSQAKMRCTGCKTERAVPASCPKCEGVNFKSLGAGTEEVTNELKATWPDRQIIRIDSTEKFSPESLATDQKKIIVATESALSHIIWPTIDLAAILDGDMAFAIPELKSLEKLWITWRRLLSSLNKDVELFIQTTQPEREFIGYLRQPAKFYEAELKQRRALNYPPYSFLLKIFYGNPDRTACEAEAKKIYQSINALTVGQFSANITNPLAMNPYWRERQYWQAIIAKIPYSAYKKTTILLSRALPPDWKTDPNPNNLLSQ